MDSKPALAIQAVTAVESLSDEELTAISTPFLARTTVLIAGYGFDLLCAGPRETMLYAIFRQNSGCTLENCRDCLVCNA